MATLYYDGDAPGLAGALAYGDEPVGGGYTPVWPDGAVGGGGGKGLKKLTDTLLEDTLKSLQREPTSVTAKALPPAKASTPPAPAPAAAKPAAQKSAEPAAPAPAAASVPQALNLPDLTPVAKGLAEVLSELATLLKLMQATEKKRAALLDEAEVVKNLLG